ncbi:MAG: hypothetical protein HZB98_01230, partial [Bacteroidia bacterium]|nr:hypothetical protein [Bacteroidia bacterium]
MMSRFILFFFFTLSISFLSLNAQPGIKAVFTETSPVIDGYINDEVWKQAPVIDQLYQREPNSGEPASKKSAFYFLYDHHNIYVGVRCFDDPKAISSKELSR